jgi:GxxExxY protein
MSKVYDILNNWIKNLIIMREQPMSIELKYKDITEKIIGASFEVHKFLGNGFQEVIYQRALAYEMRQSGLNFKREIEQHIYYKNMDKPLGTRRADFVVEGKVLVELKAIIELQEVHWAQILNYLKVYRFEVGLLINFGSKSLTFKRFVL